MPIVSIMPNNGQKAKNDGQIAKKAFMMFAREEKTEIGTWIIYDDYFTPGINKF